MPDLYPTFEVPEDIADEAIESPEIDLNSLRTAKFDFDKGRTVIDLKGNVVVAEKQEAYRQWVMKCVMTERYEYLAYGPDFGVEAKAIMRANYPRDIAESELERAVREALMVDPRTVSVDNFSFEWLGDGVKVNCVVTSIYDQEEFNFTLGGET
jgi:hypothetical protein